jgi:MtfA peptidase
MIRWLARRRRQKLRERPFPQEWRETLERDVPLYRRLSPEEKKELHGHVHVLLSEKNFEGCGGIDLTDGMTAVIAAQAALLLLHRETEYFPGLSSVIVYPDLFTGSRWERDDAGIVTEGDEDRSGECWEHGTIVLSWKDVCMGNETLDGYNVVLHEFAHQLDEENGAEDGVPLLADRATVARWREVMEREFRSLSREVRRRRHTFIDPYAAEHPAEFFAVATEYFFEKPLLLKVNHTELYDILREYYRQDPARFVLSEEPAGE